MAAALIPKILRGTGNQNVCTASYAVQSCSYSSGPRIIKNPTTASMKRGPGGRSSFNGLVCTIFGSSGYLGSPLAVRMARIGSQMILPHRCEAYFMKELKVAGDLGQVFIHPFHLKDEESIIRVMKYSNVVINCIGAVHETSNFSFKDVHVDGARRIARLAKQLNVPRFIHVSCLNAEEHPTPIIMKEGSKILKSKWEGEQAVRQEFPEATIVRPSNIFGFGDKFVNFYIAWINSSASWSLPLWDRGVKTEKQPVYIGDVIDGIVAIANDPSTAGKTYQFVGPKRHNLNDLVTWFTGLLDTENPLRIVDLKINLHRWLKIYYWETVYSFQPVRPLLWEMLETQHTSDKIDPTLPTLEDLGVKLTNIESRIHFILKPYEIGRTQLLDEQKLKPSMMRAN